MKSDLNDTELDVMFEATLRDTPAPSVEFLERLERDALSTLTKSVEPVRHQKTSVSSLFGGWSGLGGLVAAGVTGIWIGVAPPSGILDPLDLLDGSWSGLNSEADPMFGGSDWNEVLIEDAENV